MKQLFLLMSFNLLLLAFTQDTFADTYWCGQWGTTGISMYANLTEADSDRQGRPSDFFVYMPNDGNPCSLIARCQKLAKELSSGLKIPVRTTKIATVMINRDEDLVCAEDTWLMIEGLAFEPRYPSKFSKLIKDGPCTQLNGDFP